MKCSAQWNIADKEALLAAVEPFYEEPNRLPIMGSSRGTDDRALAYSIRNSANIWKIRQWRKNHIRMLQARVQELECRRFKKITDEKKIALAGVEAFNTERNRVPGLGVQDKDERALAYNYGKRPECLEESDNGGS